MVLMPPNNLQSNSCGSVNKCSACMYRLICPISPFCSINNSSGGTNSTNINSVLNVINEGFNAQSTNLQNLISMVQILSNSLNEMNNTINELNTKIDDINSKITSVQPSSISTISLDSSDVEIYPPQEINSNNDNNYTLDNQGIIPYNPKEGTVLVEKKGLFGKTKWVEEKIK